MPVEFSFDFEKTKAAILFFAGREDVDSMQLDVYKLNKLLFLADKYHLVTYGRTVTGDSYFAMDHGPVPTEVYNLLKAVLRDTATGQAEDLSRSLELDRRFQYPRFRAREEFDASVLSESDIEALQHAAELYGRKSFAELHAITHEMPAYRKVWDENPDHGKSERMQFEDFFEEDSEAMSGSLEEMIENDALRKQFSEI